MAEHTAPPATAPAAEKKRGKLIPVIGVLVVLLTGAGGGLYWWMRTAAASTAEPAAEEPEPTGVVGFDPFVVNLADGQGTRFLRVAVQLVIRGKEEAEEVGKDDVLKARLRSEVLDLLAQQTSDTLVTSEGKTALKKEIAKRASMVIKPHEVSDVLFTDFLVQF